MGCALLLRGMQWGVHCYLGVQCVFEIIVFYSCYTPNNILKCFLEKKLRIWILTLDGTSYQGTACPLEHVADNILVIIDTLDRSIRPTISESG